MLQSRKTVSRQKKRLQHQRKKDGKQMLMARSGWRVKVYGLMVIKRLLSAVVVLIETHLQVVKCLEDNDSTIEKSHALTVIFGY